MTSGDALRIGIDVGGTNTDAVVLGPDDGVRARAKTPTSGDVTAGIRRSLAAVLAAPDVAVDRVTHVMLGTTHATNALLERRRLERVAVVRIGGPATHSVRPFAGWPADLRDAIAIDQVIVDGGAEYDGRELVPLDRDALGRFLERVGGSAEAVAVTGVFSPAAPAHELAARDLARELLGPDVPISLGHEIGSVGLLERENATILNAALSAVARDVATALATALDEHRLDVAVLLAQNDGTLMALDYAIRYPVLTIGSGPANSLRGAAAATHTSDALVIDVGGTSADVGVLVAGFPRESSSATEIGGIRTNFRMPDVLSIAVGGGTILRAGRDGVRVGPDSVGFELEQRALVFGGDTPTLTDAAVAAGRADLGDRTLLAGYTALLADGLAAADDLVADAIDRMRSGREAQPLVAVGGGSVILPAALPGVSTIERPANYDVANAIGAAIAMVSGRWEEVVNLDGNRRIVLDAACDRARTRAIEAGAEPDQVEIVEVLEVPLAYLDRPAARISVKAAGPLRAGTKGEVHHA